MQQLDQTFAVGVQKAEVAGAPEALGQDMLEQQPQEGSAGEGAGFGAAGFAVAIAEGDLAVVAGEDVFLLEDAAVPIAAQIDQGLFARADVLAVDDPLVGLALGQGQPGLGDSGEHLGPEHLGQRFVVEQIALAGLGAPPPLFGVEGGGGHDHMHVGVVVQAAGMGVQHGDGAGRTLKVLVVAAEGQQRLPGRTASADHRVCADGPGPGAEIPPAR